MTPKLDQAAIEELDRLLKVMDEHEHPEDGFECCFCHRPFGIGGNGEPVPFCWRCSTDTLDDLRRILPALLAAAKELDQTREQLRLALAVVFSDEPPTEQGWYWWWNGDDDSLPVPISVLYSGASGKCFVSMGQLGITRAVDCDEFGGKWSRLREPSTDGKPHPGQSIADENRELRDAAETVRRAWDEGNGGDMEGAMLQLAAALASKGAER